MTRTKALIMGGSLLMGTIVSIVFTGVLPSLADPVNHSTTTQIISQIMESSLTGTITKIQGNQVTLRLDDGKIYTIKMSYDTINNNALAVGKRVVTVVRAENLVTDDVTVVPVSRSVSTTTVKTEETVNGVETTTKSSESTSTESKTIRGMW